MAGQECSKPLSSHIKVLVYTLVGPFTEKTVHKCSGKKKRPEVESARHASLEFLFDHGLNMAGCLRLPYVESVNGLL